MKPAEKALLDYLIAYNSIHHRVPNYKQMVFDLNIDRSVIVKYMKGLESAGKVRRIFDPVIYELVEEESLK